MADDTTNKFKKMLSFFEGIRDERNTAANTASRIGRAFIMLLDYCANGVAGLYLSKTKDDETTHKLTMGEAEVKGALTVGGEATMDTVHSKGFSKGTAQGFDGTGFGIWKDENGRSNMELDNLIVRMKMIIAELEVHEMSYIGGSVVLSPCGNRIDFVKGFNKAGDDVTKEGVTDKTVSYYRCYFLANDGTREVKNEWVVGQFARCKTNNITKAGTYTDYQNQDYWRLCVGVSSAPVKINDNDNKEYHYIDLSNSTEAVTLSWKDKDTDGSEVTKSASIVGVDAQLNSTPAAGDKVIGLGHLYDTTRQNAAVFDATGNIGWTLYKGINTYSLDDKYIVNKFSVDETIVTTDHYLLRPYAQPSETTTVVCMRGAYDASKNYGHNDLVTNNGQVYICLVKVGDKIKGIAPDDPDKGALNWAVYTAKGADGKDGQDGKSARRTAVVSVTSENGTVFNNPYETILKCKVMIDGKDMGGKIPRGNFTWTKDGEVADENNAYRFRTASSSDSLDLWKCSVKIPKRLLEPIELTTVRVEGNNLIFRASEDITGKKLYSCSKRYEKGGNNERNNKNRNKWFINALGGDMVDDFHRFTFSALGDNLYSVDMSSVLSYVSSHYIQLHHTERHPADNTVLKHGKHTYWAKKGDDGKFRAWGRYGVMLAEIHTGEETYTPLSTRAKFKIYIETDSDTATTGTAYLSI